MTKKEFKRAMQCGLGRCIQELKSGNDIEKYRDIVLWGCTHNISYDTQCEGTRSYYLYQIVKLYPDTSIFTDAAAKCFYKTMCCPGWDFSQFCQFLALFAGEGNFSARRILKDGYGKLYDILTHKTCCRPNGTFPEAENFEELCISIVNTAKTEEKCLDLYLEAAENIGLLIHKNHLFTDWPFDWFQAYWENEFGRTRIYQLLKEQAEISDGIAIYRNTLIGQAGSLSIQQKENHQYTRDALSVYEQLKNKETDEKKFPILLARRMRKEGNEAEKLADYYRRESDPLIRAKLLRLLSNKDCADLLNIDTLIEDSKSDCQQLQDYAFTALGNIRDERVRNYALSLTDSNEPQEHLFYMLAKNYQKSDQDYFISIVKKIPVSYQEKISWHGPFSAVLDIFEDDSIEHKPTVLLPYLYEHTLCSCCRESIVREMQRQNIITPEILQECLYDSNSEIRTFAQNALKNET